MYTGRYLSLPYPFSAPEPAAASLQNNSFTGSIIVPQAYNHLRAVDMAHNSFGIEGSFAGMLSSSQPRVTDLIMNNNHK
jgi:hypothetical protein